MLSAIHIRDFVLVEQMSLQLNAGLTVITGETGAGKSIWLDAIQYALGERADASVIMAGRSRCQISCVFSLGASCEVREWLDTHGFDASVEECTIRRVIHRDRASQSFINDQPCTLATVKALAAQLIFIRGQHAGQQLQQSGGACQILDVYAGASAQRLQVQRCYHRLRECQHDVDQLKARAAERAQEQALLTYQFEECEQLAIAPGEWETLNEQHQRCAQYQELQDNLLRVQSLLASDDQPGALLPGLGRAEKWLSPYASGGCQALLTMLAAARCECEEALREVNALLGSMSTDQSQLDTLERRMADIHALARKHQCPPEGLVSHHEALKAALARQLTQQDAVEQAEQALMSAQGDYDQAAQELSKLRCAAAKQLEEAMQEQLAYLNMADAAFRVRLTHDAGKLRETGYERIDFEVMMNPGQAYAPLASVASGGELSRVYLALQVLTVHAHQPDCFIVDEVDQGIGGKSARCVGQLLSSLARQAQVICVTHLAQVAVYADHHYAVEKEQKTGVTRSAVQYLSAQQRRVELARMLGHDGGDDEALRFIDRLIEEGTC